MDSHAPQTESIYHYDDDDWGEQYENEYVQTEDAHESYHTEQDYEQEHYENNDQEEGQDQDEDPDEDDQDNYEWHEDKGMPPTMDIYMSELRIMDEEPETLGAEREILETENIKPGGKFICHASVQLLLNHHEATTRKVRAKLDSCGSVSIAQQSIELY